MNRKIIVFIITLILCVSGVVIFNKDVEVEATAGGENNGNIGLDYDYIWNVTKDLADVIWNAYDEGNIRKGRAFGTKGDNFTAYQILKPYMEGECGLSNVEVLKLGPIPKWVLIGRYYTSKIDETDFRLHIDREDYHTNTSFPNTIPISEIFVFPSGLPKNIGGSLTCNFTLLPEDNVRIRPTHDNWCSGGSLTGYYLNLSCTSANKYDSVIGNVTYIKSNEPLPAEQDTIAFLIDEEQGCEDKLDNITNASAVILIYNSTKGYQTQNATNCSSSVVRVNSNDNNLSEILEKLKNETIIVDNICCNETLTFTYNLNCSDWPDYNFVCSDMGGGDIVSKWYLLTVLLRVANIWHLVFPPHYQCKGVLLYDVYNETHYMNYNNPSLKNGGWFRIYYTDLAV